MHFPGQMTVPEHSPELSDTRAGTRPVPVENIHPKGVPGGFSARAADAIALASAASVARRRFRSRKSIDLNLDEGSLGSATWTAILRVLMALTVLFLLMSAMWSGSQEQLDHAALAFLSWVALRRLLPNTAAVEACRPKMVKVSEVEPLFSEPCTP
mmetsp:Transcript_23254/g.54915  ORF Transcript_23254/g.54915 Transcript_23254/m.54915 type:complete len:156 (-) Transcript_23254:30-497(-)|eukprot:s4653_g1.t1